MTTANGETTMSIEQMAEIVFQHRGYGQHELTLCGEDFYGSTRLAARAKSCATVHSAVVSRYEHLAQHLSFS